MAPTLGYWELRGLGHAIRLLLHYKEVEFENKMYNDPQEWFGNDKLNLGLKWPNLPYYIDGDVKITETSAIFAHLGRKHGLDGSTEQAKINNDMTYSAALWRRIEFVRVLYGDNYDEKKDELVAGLDDKVAQFSKELGDQDWFGGSELVYADFCVYDLLDIWNQFKPGCVEKHDNLKAFMARFAALPTLQKFMNSDKSMKNGPFNGPNAHWGAAKWGAK